MYHSPSIHNPYWHYCHYWMRFRRILYLLEYSDLMAHMQVWARRKHLSGAAHYYQRQQQQTEIDMMHCRFRNRGLVILCEFLHTAWGQIRPSSWDRPAYVRRDARPRRRR